MSLSLASLTMALPSSFFSQAAVIQATYRGFVERREFRAWFALATRAALLWQTCWRRFACIRWAELKMIRSFARLQRRVYKERQQAYDSHVERHKVDVYPDSASEGSDEAGTHDEKEARVHAAGEEAAAKARGQGLDPMEVANAKHAAMNATRAQQSFEKNWRLKVAAEHDFKESEAQLQTRVADAGELIGRRCKVYWPLEEYWYEGKITKYNSLKRRHRVDYDDGDHEWIDLKEASAQTRVVVQDAWGGWAEARTVAPARKQQHWWERGDGEGRRIADVRATQARHIKTPENVGRTREDELSHKKRVVEGLGAKVSHLKRDPSYYEQDSFDGWAPIAEAGPRWHMKMKVKFIRQEAYRLLPLHMEGVQENDIAKMRKKMMVDLLNKKVPLPKPGEAQEAEEALMERREFQS